MAVAFQLGLGLVGLYSLILLLAVVKGRTPVGSVHHDKGSSLHTMSKGVSCS